MNWAHLSPPTEPRTQPIRPNFAWEEIDAIFLDMDGTLLDKYYDDFFWEHHVPEVYARRNTLDPGEARRRLLAVYRSVENTLQWTDLDYWSARLDLDIVALKREVSHLIGLHPHVLDFLAYLRDRGKACFLVTNAHPKTLEVKMEKVDIAHWFSRLICSQEVGAAKEQPEFWQRLQDILPFDPARTLFADDTEKVLHSAAGYGMRHLIHVAGSSSRTAPCHSSCFPSILTFRELMF